MTITDCSNPPNGRPVSVTVIGWLLLANLLELYIAEFFVTHRYRRSGVGRRAAVLLWNRLPGKWLVRVSEGNTGAVPFWERVVGEFTEGTATTSTRPGTCIRGAYCPSILRREPDADPCPSTR